MVVRLCLGLTYAEVELRHCAVEAWGSSAMLGGFELEAYLAMSTTPTTCVTWTMRP